MREVGPFEDRKEASVSRKKSTGKLRAGMGYTACRGLLENPPPFRMLSFNSGSHRWQESY